MGLVKLDVYIVHDKLSSSSRQLVQVMILYKRWMVGRQWNEQGFIRGGFLPPRNLEIEYDYYCFVTGI